jgi:hypothetical protein
MLMLLYCEQKVISLFKERGYLLFFEVCHGADVVHLDIVCQPTKIMPPVIGIFFVGKDEVG